MADEETAPPPPNPPAPVILHAWLPANPLPILGEDEEAPKRKPMGVLLLDIPRRLKASAPVAAQRRCKAAILELTAKIEEIGEIKVRMDTTTTTRERSNQINPTNENRTIDPIVPFAPTEETPIPHASARNVALWSLYTFSDPSQKRITRNHRRTTLRPSVRPLRRRLWSLNSLPRRRRRRRQTRRTKRSRWRCAGASTPRDFGSMC